MEQNVPMDERISLEAIALYSDEYATKVLAGAFDKRPALTGQELLSLCPVNQVNLFLVGGLFRLWKEEVKKLKSPYFDYEHAEVQQALQQFMNVLSRHIRVDKEHLLPLLKKAVSTALLVVFSPYDYYSSVIAGTGNMFQGSAFREELRYLKVNKAPLERLLQKLEETGQEEIPGNQAFALLDQILEEVNFTPADVEPFIEQFSQTLPLDPERFYVKVKTPAPQKKEVPTAAPTQTETRNRTTVADELRKIERIRDTLTINQKFMFTKVLFNGDFELFSQTIDEIDRQATLTDALRKLEAYLHTWDTESEEYQEFMEILEQRFA
jgi:negative regulator of replication initiation